MSCLSHYTATGNEILAAHYVTQQHSERPDNTTQHKNKNTIRRDNTTTQEEKLGNHLVDIMKNYLKGRTWGYFCVNEFVFKVANNFWF
jgi:hypothetical protein